MQMLYFAKKDEQRHKMQIQRQLVLTLSFLSPH